MSESTAVARRDEEPKGIAKLILHSAARARIEPFLPQGIDIDRVVAAVQLAVKDNPQIAECEPSTIIRSIARIYQRGGEVGVTSYLVPFKTKVPGTNEYRSECTDIDDYKFLVQLILATGLVRGVQPDVVLEGEHFKCEKGLHPVLEHRPKTAQRVGARIVAAYVIFRLPRGEVVFDFMSIDEIEAIRAKSKQWSPSKVKDCPRWYAIKTVIRRMAKMHLTNPRLAALFAPIARQLDEEERAEFGETEVGVIEAGQPDEGTPATQATPQSDDDDEESYRAEERRWAGYE